MKCKLIKNSKLWIALTVFIIILGIVFISVFNFNNTVEYKDGYEVKVSLDQNFTGAEETIKETSEKYFNDNGLVYLDYETVTYNEGGAVVYKLSTPITIAQTEALNDAVKDALTAKGGSLALLIPTTSGFIGNSSQYFDISTCIIAIAIALVATFIYLYIMEKAATAFTVILTSLIAGAVFTALLGVTRIPALPYAGVAGIIAVVLSAVLAISVLSRCKEMLLNVANEKVSYKKIADKAVSLSLKRILFIAGAILVASILLIALGSMYVKFLAMQLLLAGGVAVVATLIWVPIIWSTLKKINSTKRVDESATVSEN